MKLRLGLKKLIAYGAIYIFWGASFLAIRVVVQVMPPFLAAGIRFLAAGLILLSYTQITRQPLPRRAEWRSIVIIGTLLFVCCYGAVFWSEQHLPSSLAAVIAATIPAWVTLLDWTWLRRTRVTLLSVLGVVAGLGGVAAVVLPPDILTNPSAIRTDAPALVMLASTLFWAMATALSTRLPLPKSAAVCSAWEMLVGGVGLLLIATALGDWHHLTSAALSFENLASMAYLVLFASIAAVSAYLYLLAREPAGRVASYAYVNPVLAMLLGTWLAGEHLTGRQLAACAIVIAGVVCTLSGRDSAPRRPMEPAEELATEH